MPVIVLVHMALRCAHVIMIYRTTFQRCSQFPFWKNSLNLSCIWRGRHNGNKFFLDPFLSLGATEIILALEKCPTLIFMSQQHGGRVLTCFLFFLPESTTRAMTCVTHRPCQTYFITEQQIFRKVPNVNQAICSLMNQWECFCVAYFCVYVVCFVHVQVCTDEPIYICPCKSQSLTSDILLNCFLTMFP